jgi:hypothetical protein
VHNNIN